MIKTVWHFNGVSFKRFSGTLMKISVTVEFYLRLWLLAVYEAEQCHTMTFSMTFDFPVNVFTLLIVTYILDTVFINQISVQIVSLIENKIKQNLCTSKQTTMWFSNSL